MRCRSPAERVQTARSGSSAEPVGAADLVEPPAHRLERGPVAGERDGDVLGDGELVEQREVLEHHADAERGAPRPASRSRPAGPPRRSRRRVGSIDAVEDLDQGRLAGAVLAEKRVDLAAADRQVDAVVGEELAVALRDAAQRDEGAPPSGPGSQDHRTFDIR